VCVGGQHITLGGGRAHREDAARHALEALRDPGLGVLDEQRTAPARRRPHRLVVLEVAEVANRRAEPAARGGRHGAPELHVRLRSRRVDHEVRRERQDRLAQLVELGGPILNGAEVHLERARRASLEVSRLARHCLGEVGEPAATEAAQERRLGEPVHQLDRGRIRNRDDDLDAGGEKQLERRRRDARAEIDDDPVRRQLVQLPGEVVHLRGARLGDPRRIVDAADQPHAGHVGRHRELAQARTVRDERYRQRPRRSRYAGEDVKVSRAERSVDEDHPLAERREKDPNVRGNQALADTTLAASNGDHARAHRRADNRDRRTRSSAAGRRTHRDVLVDHPARRGRASSAASAATSRGSIAATAGSPRPPRIASRRSPLARRAASTTAQRGASPCPAAAPAST
jgi:hypothetical protein